jgi:hypothetical protein
MGRQPLWRFSCFEGDYLCVHSRKWLQAVRVNGHLLLTSEKACFPFSERGFVNSKQVTDALKLLCRLLWHHGTFVFDMV